MDPLTYLIRKFLDNTNADQFLFGEEGGNLPSFEERFCPNCGSDNVEPDDRHTNNLGELIFDLNKWLCNDCGYTGIMPLESQEGQEDIDFEPVNQEQIDTSAGRGLFKYCFKILIPSLILAYIFFRLVSF